MVSLAIESRVTVKVDARRGIQCCGKLGLIIFIIF